MLFKRKEHQLRAGVILKALKPSSEKMFKLQSQRQMLAIEGEAPDTKKQFNHQDTPRLQDVRLPKAVNQDELGEQCRRWSITCR